MSQFQNRLSKISGQPAADPVDVEMPKTIAETLRIDIERLNEFASKEQTIGEFYTANKWVIWGVAVALIVFVAVTPSRVRSTHRDADFDAAARVMSADVLCRHPASYAANKAFCDDPMGYRF